jgi:hypothetical protein
MEQRGQGDELQSVEPYADEPVRRRGTVPLQDNQPQVWGQQPSPGFAPPMGYAPAAPPKKKSKLRIGCLGAVGLLVLIVVSSVAANGGKDGSTAAKTTPPTAAPAATGTAVAAVAPVATTAPAAPPAQTVTYSCTGHAGDGVDITYGAEGSNASASHLPFSVTMPLDSNAEYFNVTAQLQGDGTVSCTTVVNYADDSGDAQSVTQSGTASGGYNIASAEVCSDLDDGWQAC